jgi:squalene cyclase
MNWGIRCCWGTGTDVDVLANFCHALLVADLRHTLAWVDREASRLVSRQQADGTWRGTWYWGCAYGTALVVRLLQAVKVGADAVQRALASFLRTQRDDGAWGSLGPLPLETAVSAWVLETADGEGAAAPVDAGCNWLVRTQNPDGSWFSSPWIQMPIGRATGTVTRLALHESVTVTTAFCLRTLVVARARSRRSRHTG